MPAFEIGERVRIKRGGRRIRHTPCVGEFGIVQLVPADDDEPYGYAIRLPEPHPTGMTVNYWAEELEKVS